MMFRTEDPARLDALRKQSDAFLIDAFDSMHQGIPTMHPYEKEITIGRPDRVPHPRILLRKDMLQDIRQAMDCPEAVEATRVFQEMINTPESGMLPPATERPKGFYTFNNRILAALQAKALAYLLSGNREYGFEALIGIRNYLSTIYIRWLKADICRHFGYAMYVAACIYDWCYDLTDEEIRKQIICGVGYCLCIGETEGILKPGSTVRIDKTKMEMGFPPEKQGPISGHGTELQLLRDYLSFSMAIYEEEPSWWNFVGQRFYAEYPAAREAFYKAGIYPQGTCYAPFRMQSDAWACWLIRNVFGEMPFPAEDMLRTVRTLVNYEIEDMDCMRSGDDGAVNGRFREADSYVSLTLICSYLFCDRGLKAWAKHFEDGYSSFEDNDPDFHGRPNRISPAEFLILHSNHLMPAEDRYENIPLVVYNGSFSGTVMVKTGHSRQNPMCMMRGLYRTTANHDHQEAGTFQIAYKGLVCGDSGVYETYGSPQHLYYHQATIAHNGVLVFNPEYSDTRVDEYGKPVNPAAFYYSGGQRYMEQSRSLKRWLQPDYDMAKELGCFVQWRQGTNCSVPAAVSYGIDTTSAYPENTVRSIRRYMLALFPEKDEAAMLLIVLDEIEPLDPTFRKAFLLQCPAEPAVNGNTLTITQEGGQIKLFCLQGCDALEIYGLPDRQYYNARDGRGEGVNISCIVPGKYSPVWGHAEVVNQTSEEHTRFLNVLCVSDAGKTSPCQATLLKGEGYTGAQIQLATKSLSVLFTREGFSGSMPQGNCYIVDDSGYCVFHDEKRSSLPDAEFGVCF